MTEIPEDVMKAAGEVALEILGLGPTGASKVIARAIMAERERCAKRYAEATAWDYFAEAEAAIRRGPTPPKGGDNEAD